LKDSRYADAGVDIDAKAAALARARTAIRSTFTPAVLGDVGGFGGLFRPDFSSYKEPVLVGSTDGVGTKLKIAIAMDRHDTCGGDLVNHCVDDILVQGARPLFFLDYIATGKVESGVIGSIIEGIARACRENGTALLGGETAEMPGVYTPPDYDLAGFIVGYVDEGESGASQFGQVADMPAISAIARKYGLLVIEDAAHAHGASYNRRPAGSLGHIASFSFQSSKNLTAGVFT